MLAASVPASYADRLRGNLLEGLPPTRTRVPAKGLRGSTFFLARAIVSPCFSTS